MDTRWKWILELRPGDLVCTCTYEHKRIERIEDITEVKGDTALIPWVLAMVSLPYAYEVQKRLKKVHGEEVEERIVYFADGTKCYATRCLDPVGPGCLHE